MTTVYSKKERGRGDKGGGEIREEGEVQVNEIRFVGNGIGNSAGKLIDVEITVI